jgi:RNA polymerase sigma-70 factor (ECF subfamily)
MARDRVDPKGFNALLPTADTDLPYVERVRKGDTEAYGLLWRKYEHALYQFFLKRTNDRQESEDLASETLFAAMQSIPQFRGATLDTTSEYRRKNCSFRTYLQAIARYKLAHWIRRKRTRNEIHVEDFAMSPHGEADGDWMEIALAAAESTDSNPLSRTLENDERDTVGYALARIGSDAQYAALLMHYLGGMPHQDIATALRTRSETINSRLQDGRKALRREYEFLDGIYPDAG